MAIPTHDLDETVNFYTKVMGAPLARRYNDRVTFNFFSHQVVCHLDPDGCDKEVKIYPRHFGITFKEGSEFDALYEQSSQFQEHMFSKLFTRFEGKPEVHRTFFLKDPSNNLLEFKHYENPQFVY